MSSRAERFPPPYTLKVNARAKYARLKMTPYGGLVVVVPEGFPEKQVLPLLLRHEQWIRKTAQQLDAHRSSPLPVMENGLPHTISFPHYDEEWQVEYARTRDGEVELVEEGVKKRLLVSGDVANAPLCSRLLSSWVKQRAHHRLLPDFKKLAAALDFNYAEAKVRLQHSRWGSCTSNHVITLNTKLLFLPEYLIRHIMVHELCHTVHLNHSRAFWSLVARHDPLWRSNNNEMKSAWKYVPAWVSAKP